MSSNANGGSSSLSDYRELSSYSSGGGGDRNVNQSSLGSSSSTRQYQQQQRNYRDYDESPRPRYNNYSNNSNSLERPNAGGGGGRYKTDGEGGCQRQSGPHDSTTYDRSDRAYNNRTPPVRGGGGGGSNVSASSSASSSIDSTNSLSSRAISPSAALAQQQQQRQQSPLTLAATSAPASGRWVPPSLRPQHGLTQNEKNDAVFRRVRGILNKLTPEKFQELSDDLLKLDLKSIDILKGIILLIFDKALDEPKYSSMYAQLCKRLSKEAPTFEANIENNSNACTFLRLLIGVCRDRFNNRLKNNPPEDDNGNQFNKAHKSNHPQPGNDENASGNTDTEEERRHLAKQRMLGNVKFIGELKKLQMLSENVLHQCIQQLLDKKKKRSSVQEMCEDMECLSQLLKTCGKNLDSEQGKELMKQYFERLERRSKSTEYPPRIRFMLKDVIELRENGWIPRKVGTTEGPVPMKQIRTDDDNLIRTPYANRNRDMRNNDRDGDNWMNRFHLNLQPGFNDMFGSLSVGGSSPIMSPGYNNGNNNNRQYNNQRNNQNNHHNNYNNNNNNRYNKHNNNNQNGSGGGGGGVGGGGGGGGNMSGGGTSNRGDNRDGNGGHNQHNHTNSMMHSNNRNDQSGPSSQYNQMLSSKELAPRFKRNLMSTNQDSVENLQMRPAPNSLLFKVTSQNQKTPTMLPISTPLASGSGNSKNGNSQQQNNKDQQLSSKQQYPLLATPTSHLSNPVRPSSTPSAEYQSGHTPKTHQPALSTAAADKGTTAGLKSISSSPNFTTPIVGGKSSNADAMESSANRNSGSKNQQQDAFGGASGGQQQPNVVTKHGSIETTSQGSTTGGGKQPKKDKAFNKEEVLKKTSVYVKEKFFYVEENEPSDEEEANGTIEAANGDNSVESGDQEQKKINLTAAEKQIADFFEGFIQLKVPEKSIKDVCINMVMDVLDKSEDKYLDRIVIFLQMLRKQMGIKPNVVLEMFKQVINKMNEREALNPRIATHVANLLSKAVSAALLKLTDIAAYTENGLHYPLFLLVLQQMHKSIGKEALEEKFRESKIDLINSLPEVDRNKTRLTEILDDRNLAFLYPLLKLQAEMMKQLTAESNPTTFYKWIKTTVDAKYYKDPGFVTALITVILKFVTQETSLAEGSDIKKHPEKPIIEKEEALLHKYCQILETFLIGSNDLQLIALYALQVFCYTENFPKGMLCRWFKYLYEANVIEEETFFLWKEQISDKYPGKGAALFQVNHWLTWLEEAESEDEED